MSEQVASTPSSRWAAAGGKDPHEDRYDCDRSQTAMGHLSDDELANALFLCDHRRSLESIAYLTAAKDRIRWLSRALAASVQDRAALAKRVGEISDDFHPGNEREAPLALQEMRDTLSSLVS